MNFDGPTGEGLVVMGKGFGHITSQANRHELGARLRKLASSCGANCIGEERVCKLQASTIKFQRNCKFQIGYEGCVFIELLELGVKIRTYPAEH